MKLSIIIPIYNAAEYLHENLSLLLKDCGDSQVILVNDGSTDNSEEICKMFSDSDSRVTFVTQPNSGPGAARNSGLKKAAGEWVYFMDADDRLSAGAFEQIDKCCNDGNSDLYVFGFRVIDKDCEVDITFPDKKIPRSSFGDYLKEYVLGIAYGNGFLWNKLYRRSIIHINNIHFDIETRVQEDEIFNLDYLSKCQRIELNSQILYNYNITTPSNSRTRYLNNYFECIVKVHYCFENLFNQFQIPLPLSLFNRTLQAVMVNELMFYFRHADNPLSIAQRCARLKMIGDSDVYLNSFNRVKESGKMPVEWICYNQAVNKGSLVIFKFWSKFFTVLRNLKHSLFR